MAWWRTQLTPFFFLPKSVNRRRRFRHVSRALKISGFAMHQSSEHRTWNHVFNIKKPYYYCDYVFKSTVQSSPLSDHRVSDFLPLGLRLKIFFRMFIISYSYDTCTKNEMHTKRQRKKSESHTPKLKAKVESVKCEKVAKCLKAR
jgi:hypothetical protein